MPIDKETDRRMVQNFILEAQTIARQEKGLEIRLKPLVGRNVRITCDRYNGQMCGTSRPKLKGKVLTIAWALRWDDTIGVGFAEHDSGVDIKKVEFI